MKKERPKNNLFSVMKGIAIASVVIGHCSPPIVEGFVNQYHLAVFYFLSGYFFKEKYFATPLLFMKKRLKRLYLPFVAYGVVFLILHNLFCNINFYPSQNIYSFQQFGNYLFNLFAKMASYEPFMGAMWFLPSLLITSFLFLGIGRMCYIYINKYVKSCLMYVGVILCFVGGFYAIRQGFPNPWCIWSSMVIIALFYIGYIFQENNVFIRYINGRVEIFAFLLVLIATGLGVDIRLQPALIGNSNPLLFLLVTLAGVIMIYGFARQIMHSRLGHIIAQLGDYSFEIMALHFICFKFVAFLHVSISESCIEHLSDFPVFNNNLWLWMPFYAIVGCILPVKLKQVIEKLRLKKYK